MEKLRRNRWKIFGIVLICTMLDIIAHQFGPDVFNVVGIPQSIIVKNGLFIPAVIIMFLITFGVLAVIFVLIQDNLQGTKIFKGFIYGLSFGCLWFIGMIEASLILGTPLKNELFTGMADGLPIILMGLLLGVFTGTDTAKNNIKKRSNENIISIFVITIFYVVGRYSSYTIIHIDSAYSTKPCATFLWTVGIGLWVGVMYWLLKQGLKGYSPIKRALMFGGLIYGTDWLLYNFFIPLFFETSLVDLLLRAGIDIVFVIVGVFMFEKFVHTSKLALNIAQSNTGIIIIIILLSGCAIAPIIGGSVNQNKLVDGNYQGSYKAGLNNAVVEVTIKNNRIDHIEIVKHDAWKGKKAEPIILLRIIKNQSTKVDAVTGATNSSRVIMNAVQKAIEKSYSNQ